MKKSEIESHIRQYILPGQPNYYVDQHVMYTTFGDQFFIKGYLFFSKGDREMGLKVSYFVMPLFLKTDTIAYTLGDDLYFLEKETVFKKSRNIWWNVKKECQADTFQQISKAIDVQGESILHRCNSGKDFYDLHPSGQKDKIRINEAITYSAILFASIDTQNKLLRSLIKQAQSERNLDWVHQIANDATLLLQIKHPDERIQVLKSWANETIGQLKLSKLKPFVV